MAVDEALQPAGDPGAVVRVDHRVLVLGGRVGGEQHAVEPEEQVDQLGVAGHADRAGLGDVVGQRRGRAGVQRQLLGQVGEVDELGRRDRVVEPAGARPLHGDVVQPHRGPLLLTTVTPPPAAGNIRHERPLARPPRCRARRDRRSALPCAPVIRARRTPPSA